MMKSGKKINKYNEKELNTYVKKMILDTNKDLPKIIDDIRMEKIYLEDKEFVYKLIILYSNDNKIYKYKVNNQIKKDTIDSICNNEGIRFFLEKGYSYKYTHFTESGKDLGSYTYF